MFKTLSDKKNIVVVTIFITVLLVGFVFLKPAKSLYYGTPTSSFEQSGYAVIDLDDGYWGQCGINFISDDVAITAAHCLQDASKVYANIGQFDEDFINLSPKVDSFNISPEYSLSEYEFNPGLADVGVVVFDEPTILTNYGELATPEEGCDYYLVGYGTNEDLGSMKRTGTDVCIQNITEYSFELDFSGAAHFCQGDSGSGIYEKGTNNIVGVVSAFYTPFDSTSCEDGQAFIAARLDYNIDYLEEYLPSNADQEITSTPEETVPNDYFGDYYPETQNDDGSFNYNNDILIEIDKLDTLFGEVYPEDVFEDLSADESDVSKIDEDLNQDIFFETDDTSVAAETDGVFMLLCLCLCCVLLLVFVLVFFFIIKRGKKTKVSTVATNQPVVQNN